MAGLVSTVGGWLGLAVQTPIGAWLDRTNRKRAAMLWGLLGLSVGAVVISPELLAGVAGLWSDAGGQWCVRTCSGGADGRRLLDHGLRRHAAAMFVVTEAEAAAIRAVFEQRGELSAAIELRRLFPAVTDNAQARACARTIAGWKPLPVPPRPVRLPRERP
jgi:hypothetical protein